MNKRAFSLVELMVVIAIIGILSATLLPQVSGYVYRARVSSAAASLKTFGMALDMLINDIGAKPNFTGIAANPTSDQLALMKRSSCPSAYVNLWRGPYIQNYPVSTVNSLFYYPNYFWYYTPWPNSTSGYWYTWCGTDQGILLHTYFINIQAKRDVETALFGKVSYNNAWLYWCGMHDTRNVPLW
ncbi:MAG: prepilin-type N-terminal cleavage/methylation domain-containing protein [Candidatus Omnitrophota bacterium]